MIITKATYGGRDCTQLIQDKIVSDKLVIRASNDLVGDPAVGELKFLELDIDGNSYRIKEGHVFVYPESNNRKLGIFYSNNNNQSIYGSINKSLDTIRQASAGKADIVTCVWERIQTNPFHQVISWYKSQSHLNQLLQILQCLYTAKDIGQYEYVSFLEHDVMYPEGYFDFPEFPKGQILTNMNYAGVCKDGWQSRGQNDEPFHQMTMHFDDAIQHCLSILPNALTTNSGMIESQTFQRGQWNCPNQSIHINHGVHFTSHNSIYRKDNLTLDHPYWGNIELYKNLFL